MWLSSESSPSDVEPYSYQNETADLTEIITTEVPTQKKRPIVVKNKVPISCTWPSLDRQVSINTPSIGSTQTIGEPSSSKRLSTNCDSGYSELDIYSVRDENKEAKSEVNCLTKANIKKLTVSKQDQDSKYNCNVDRKFGNCLTENL